MRYLSIGAVARECGIAPSAIRFYEKEGLLPAPGRQSGQRRYDEGVFARLEIIGLALDAGFTVGETRMFLSGFSRDTPPAARWRALAARKLEEVNALMQRAQQMKSLLESSFHCHCPSLQDCETFLRERRAAGAQRPARQAKAARR
ncbi:MAG TPA: MerR family DNA-binding transcriptional regulator [Steroidobacteraceae bacterium]|nr:MerR family DNA-binding transcriptional regulator [Steroidobacteraceae bacterium]